MASFYHIESLDSTSTYLKSNYKKYDNLTFLSCSLQLKGRGRENRVWYSEKGENLLFSILIKDKDLIENYEKLSIYTSLIIVKQLTKLGINNASIKWPNDVYVNDKKIAGILLEGISDNNGVNAIIIGIGINVNSRDFKENYNMTPTSIYLETNKEIDLELFKNDIYKDLLKMFEDIKNDISYIEEIRKRNYLKDKCVYALVNGERCLVDVIDINNNCTLKVKKDDVIYDVFAGEITFHL